MQDTGLGIQSTLGWDMELDKEMVLELAEISIGIAWFVSPDLVDGVWLYRSVMYPKAPSLFPDVDLQSSG